MCPPLITIIKIKITLITIIIIIVLVIVIVSIIMSLIVQAEHLRHQFLLPYIQDQLMTCTSMYVEEQLLSQFGTLIGFVKRAEAAQKHKGTQAEGVPLPGYGPNEAAPVLQDFASRWQASIDALHK